MKKKTMPWLLILLFLLTGCGAKAGSAPALPNETGPVISAEVEQQPQIAPTDSEETNQDLLDANNTMKHQLKITLRNLRIKK